MYRHAAMIAALVALAGAAGCSDNDNDDSPPSNRDRARTQSGTTTGGERANRTNTNVAAEDREFVRTAAIGGMYEVESGRLASRRAGDSEAKRIGQMMVEDHQAANSDLKRVARNRGIEVPGTLDSRHREKVDRLRTLEGSEFDREFLSQQVEAHRMAIQEFERASRECDDQEVRAFAARTLPTLREHGRMVEDTASRLGVSVMETDTNRMRDTGNQDTNRLRDTQRDAQREMDRQRDMERRREMDQNTPR